MKLFVKRVLILSIFVLCLFGMTILAASAAGDAELNDTHVASVTSGGATTYYADLKTAIAEAPSGSTVTVLKDTTLEASRDTTAITDKTLTVVGSAKHTITSTSGSNCAFSLEGNSTLTIENLIFSGYTKKNFAFAGYATPDTAEVVFNVTNVDIDFDGASGAFYFYGGKSAELNLTDCSFTSQTAGNAIINVKVAVTDGVNMTLDNVTLGGACGVVNTGAVGTVNVIANYENDAAAIAAKAFFRLGATEGGDLGSKYFMTLGDAMAAAQSGDTVYVIANATYGGGSLGSKTLTIAGLNKNVVLTLSKELQLNGGVVSLTIKDLTINNSACIVDIYTSTDTHTVKLENVEINSSRAADGNIFYASKTKANFEVVDCTVNSVNTNRLITVGSGGNLVNFKVTNTTLVNAVTVRADGSGIVGSASNPAVLTDLNSNKQAFNAYTGTIYANIYGGTFTGQFIYGGDGHNNVLGIKLNPTGDKTTTFTLNTSGGYYGFAYQKPSDITKNNVRIDFRNTTITESGSATSLITVSAGDQARFVVGIGENVDFGGKTIANTSYVGVAFATDAIAKTWGYDTVRIGAEGSGVYYTAISSAYTKAVDGDVLYVMKDAGLSNMTTATGGKHVTFTSAGSTPVTVTNSNTTESGILFEMYSGAGVTFTNITFNVTNRFMRSYEGNHTIIFGDGATIITNNAIFFYANGQTAGNNTTENISILDGATIRATAATSTGLFYHNQTKDWDGDGTAENRLMNVNFVIAGKIEMVSGPVYKDHNKNGTHTLYYDATTASVKQTTPSTWFVEAFPASHDPIAVRVTGFESPADVAAWAYAATEATGLTYNADPAAAEKYTFIRHSQFTHKQYNVLNTYGGEIWQLRSATGGFYQTTSLSNKGTVTFKSYNGAYVFGQDASFRMQITNTTVIFDGFQFKSEGAAVQLNAGSGAKPSTLKLINGAKIYGTTTDSTTLINIAGKDTHLYVDSTSSVTQSGTTTSESVVIQATSAWGYGSIIIEGTIASTVTGNTTCSLIKVDSTATTYAVSVNIANFMDESGASTLGTTNLFLFPAGATPNLGLCTDDDTKVDLIKAYTVSISGVDQPAFGATKTVRGDFQHYYNTLAGGMLCVDNGGTVTVLKDIALSAQMHYLEYKSLTIEGLTGAETLTVPAKTIMFNVADNGHLTVKKLLITADVFVTFRQNVSGASASVTVDEGAHVINYDLAVYNDIMIYNGNANANVTVNIKAGGSVICQSLSEVSPSYAPIYSGTGKSITVNVWGTLKNLAITPDGKNAPVFVAKASTNNAVLNIYDGALIEGTSDNEAHSGSYSGIVYFSEATNQINMYGGTVIIHGNTGFAYTGSHCTINISGGTIENRDGKYPLFFGGDQTATVSGTDEKKPTFVVNDKLIKSGTLNNAVNAFDESGYAAAATLGFAVIYLEDNNTAYTSIASAVAAVADGGTATIYVLGTSISSEVVINNKNITLVGANITGYHITSTASYTFRFDNLGTLTFKDLRISATNGLIRYQGVASAIASANRDIYINFVNTEVDANGAANYLISSVAHHGDTGSTAADQIKKCDSITVTIDEDSEINFTTSATGEVKLIRYDHNTHSNVYTFIYGDVTVNATGDADAYFYLVRSNNPSKTQITVGEKANISITLATTRQTNGKSYFTSSVGGNYTANKLYLHADAITDDNGNLTLGGVKLYTNYYNNVGYEIVITAKNTLAEAAIRGLVAENNSGLTSSKPMTTSNPIVYRAMADGVYYYTSELSTALAKFDLRTTTGGMYFWTSATVNTSYIFNNQTITFGAADGITLTTSAANLFTLTNGAKLTVENLAIKSTATSSTLATVGTFLRVDDAEATAKSTATLNNVTLTASGLPFYFGGASVADVTITGGDYTGVGMFSFGIASSDFGTSADVYFSGTVNLTVTGTAADHVMFTKTGSSDTRAMIFVNAPSVVKDSVKVTLDYVDTAVSGSHTIYLRNNGTLTIDYTNGTSTTSGWFIGGQGSSVPYATFTNVDITGTSTDHIMRPYSGTAGAYIKFIGGSITANNVTSSTNPILNFNSKMDVLFDGVTFNSTSEKALIGGTATSYTMIDCIFNVTGPVLAKTSYTMIMKNSKILEDSSLVAVSTAKATAMGFAIAVDDNAFYSSGLFATALDEIPDGGTAAVQFLVRVKAPNIVINNKNITFVGRDTTVNDLTFDSNANADLYFYGNGQYAITLQDKATVTFRDITVHAERPLFMYGATERTDLAKADRDVTLNFVNAWVSGGSASSVFMGGSGTSGCDAFTINVDETSKLLFAPSSSTESTMFYANYGAFESFTVNLDGTIEITDKHSGARIIWIFNADTAVPLTFNVSETARISFSCNETQAAANHAILDSSASAKLNIAASAIIDENGNSTLGDMYLYNVASTAIPELCITHTSNALEETIRALLAMVGSAEEKPIDYFVRHNNVYYYFNSRDAAQAFADANGATVETFTTGTFADVAAAIAGGAYFRLGGDVANGTMGVNYFEKLSELMEYAAAQGQTDITVWVLQTATDSATTTLAGVKITLTSYGTQQTLTMGGAPAFKLDADSHLVVDNVKINVTNAFVQIVNTDTTKYTKLDLEDGAYVDLKAATSDGKRYFLLLGSGSAGNTGILTVNVKQGAKINATADASGGTHGLFQISTARKNTAVAAGSSINVNGEINFSQNYTANGYAPIFMVNNPNLVINVNDGATLTMAHTGKTTTSVWHAIFCLDGGSTTVNVGNATLKANANGSLFGINGASTGAVLTVTGVTFTAENFPMGVIDGYTSNTTSNNSQKATFQNCTFTGSVASHSRMTGITLINATFNSVEHAKANFGVLRLGDSATTGYYSNLASAIASTPDGGTLWVVGNVSGYGATITDKSLTVQGISATDRPVITNSSDGSARIFSCYGDVNLTLKDLEINAKARAVTFQLIAKEWNEEGKPTAYYDNTSSSLRILNTDIYGVASGANHNDMIGLGDGKGHHYFDLYIDADSSVGYLDGNAADIRSSRDYQVIFYYASVTGDIVIEGDVFAHVYFCGDQVDYEKVANSWTVYGPNAQHMIQIGNSSTHQFVGDIIIKGNLTHKVVFPETDQNGNRVYPEDYPSRHSAYAIYVNGTTAGVFVAEGATFTIDYQNAYQPRCKAVGFAGYASDYNTTCDNGATAGRYHYWGAGALLAFLNNNAYASNRITVATDTGSNYGIVYDNTTYYSETKNDDGTTTYAYGYDYKGAKEIAELISTLTGASVTHTKDTTTFGKEIIVGIANRDIVQTYLPQLEMNEYAIIIDGNYILILAWNNAALNAGVASFKHALNACTVNGKVYLPNISGALTFVANDNWNNDFAKPEGTLWGGQYVNDNSLQYVYNGYSSTQAGHQAFMNYCNTLVAQGYTLVWQNVIENNLFRLYRNVQKGHALYVAYNDYAYKDEFIAKYAEEESALPQDDQFKDLKDANYLIYETYKPDFSDDYFENRDHQKVIRVVSMPLASVTMPDNGILVQDMSYEKVTNTLQTTLSFDGSSVGMGQIYMLEDGSFVVVDGGGTGNAGVDKEGTKDDKHPGDVPEHKAIYDVLVKMYTNVYGHAPTEEKPIHISAWYLTHAHWDHISAFTNFMKEYGSDVTMDYAIANVPVQESAYWNAELSITHSTIKNTLNYAKGGKKTLVRPQTGQKLYLANLEIEVLMTYEDHAPFDIINSNDTNTVTRFKIHNQDALNGVTAEMLYLGDSWRHSSRILCEMYGDYLQTEIVQLAHHGNIGCERILYKTINAKAVYFSHDGDSFQSYMYWSNLSTAAKAAAKNAFCYAADIWAVQNAEYTWSAPYGTYNVLEFLPARPNYEGMYELGIQPGAVAGTLISADSSKYGSYTGREQSNEYIYIHNPSKGYKSVNIVWGDLSFTYDAGVQGTWNAETHQYDGAVAGKGWVANGDNRIFVGNASTGNSQTINVELTYNAADGYENFTGTFSDNGTASIASKGTKMFTFNLGTSALPAEDITDQVVGSITVSLK